jgi:hypothetical protein
MTKSEKNPSLDPNDTYGLFYTYFKHHNVAFLFFMHANPAPPPPPESPAPPLLGLVQAPAHHRHIAP